MEDYSSTLVERPLNQIKRLPILNQLHRGGDGQLAFDDLPVVFDRFQAIE